MAARRTNGHLCAHGKRRENARGTSLRPAAITTDVCRRRYPPRENRPQPPPPSPAVACRRRRRCRRRYRVYYAVSRPDTPDDVAGRNESARVPTSRRRSFVPGPRDGKVFVHRLISFLRSIKTDSIRVIFFRKRRRQCENFSFRRVFERGWWRTDGHNIYREINFSSPPLIFFTGSILLPIIASYATNACRIVFLHRKLAAY